MRQNNIIALAVLTIIWKLEFRHKDDVVALADKLLRL